ncbi:MAG: hypothetical protein IJE97_04640 [Thermoguttaceae bacterium]|nr:hypothetical protein [Thermoguttaceae bacterium]MBQ6827392.1 hypothetical protein [Thermoguttaceae bacterium]
MPELEKTLEPSADVRRDTPSRSGFFADLGRWILRAPTLALVVFTTPFYLAAAPLVLLFAIGEPTTESEKLFSLVAVAFVALPPQLAFAALIGLWIYACRRGAGFGAKIFVAILTLPYLAAATFRLWASFALEVLRGFNAS